MDIHPCRSYCSKSINSMFGRGMAFFSSATRAMLLYILFDRPGECHPNPPISTPANDTIYFTITATRNYIIEITFPVHVPITLYTPVDLWWSHYRFSEPDFKVECVICYSLILQFHTNFIQQQQDKPQFFVSDKLHNKPIDPSTPESHTILHQVMGYSHFITNICSEYEIGWRIKTVGRHT